MPSGPFGQMTVPRDDHTIAAHENWIGKSELDDGGGDLMNLFGGVGAGVARVGNQSVNRPVFNAISDPRGGQCNASLKKTKIKTGLVMNKV